MIHSGSFGMSETSIMGTFSVQPQPCSAQRQCSVVSGLTWKWQVLIFLLAFAVIVLRRPDAIMHASFFAEDGSPWFAQASIYGWWRVLFWTDSGYIQLLPRLGATLALMCPLVYAPLVENVLAISVESLVVSLLLSRRSIDLGSLRFRFFRCFTLRYRTLLR